MDKTEAEKIIKQVETDYPDMTSEFKKIQKEQYRLFCLKQSDYGPGNIAMGTTLSCPEDVHLSITGLIIRMNDKVNRLINLVIKKRSKAVNEPAVDAFSDTSVYGIIALIVSRGKWQTKKSV